MTLLLLSPHTPMLFMGEEWGTQIPFLYFCDFDGDLARLVSAGRRAEFKDFSAFSDAKALQKIPDPNAETTFLASKLNWPERDVAPHEGRLSFSKRMLEIRKASIVPLVKSGFLGSMNEVRDGIIEVIWRFKGGSIRVIANFSGADAQNNEYPEEKHLFGATGHTLPAWKSSWFVKASHG